ncbi:MAG TPA: ATP-binding protein [Clostridiaceae bacterium]|nr:ATP-binding protein [Clostridiaceae bacterium]
MRDLSLHLLDIIQNSITAGAGRISVTIGAYISRDILDLIITDNGCGMSEGFLAQVTDPFATTRTTRRIGMGLPLLKSSAQRASGNLQVKSEEGKGTSVKASFSISHIDRPPLGNLTETMIPLISSYPEIDYELILKNDNDEYRLDTSEIKEQLGEVPITNFDVITWIKESINEAVKIIFGGVLNEINS